MNDDEISPPPGFALISSPPSGRQSQAAEESPSPPPGFSLVTATAPPGGDIQSPWSDIPNAYAPTPQPTVPETMESAGSRILNAARAGFEGAGDVLTPEADAWLRSHGAGPVATGVEYAGKAALGVPAAAFRGAQEATQVGLEPILGEQGARDIAALPEAFAGSPRMLPTRTSLHDVAEGTQMPVRPGQWTSAAAKDIASQYYKKADQVGGQLTPAFTNAFLDKAADLAPQTTEGKLVAGETPITTLTQRMEGLRDQPITLQGAQEIDEHLGDMIDGEYGLRGLSKAGRSLLNLQGAFRDMIRNADESQVEGGPEGFDALNTARKAWSQAMKISDLERIQSRADMTDNPATSIKSGIRVLLSNATKSRGYSPQEIDALKQAANRGALGGTMQVFGSRLVPYVAGGIGSAGGVFPALAAAGVGHVLSSGLRAGAARLQTGRMNNAISTIGAGVPEPP